MQLIKKINSVKRWALCWTLNDKHFLGLKREQGSRQVIQISLS